MEHPITFRELLHRSNSTATIAREKQSCLKNTSCAASDTTSSTSSSSTNAEPKQVRFATNMMNRKVWSHVKTVEKVPEERHPKLWFSEEEFQQTVEDAVSEAIREKSDEEEYVDSFNSLFKTIKKNSKGIPEQEMARVMESVSKNGGARGLEMHIVAKARDYAQKHRESVLEAQDILRQNGLHKNKKGRAMISKESIKFSTPSQVIAVQMAQFDALEAKRATKSSWKKSNRRSTIC